MKQASLYTDSGIIKLVKSSGGQFSKLYSECLVNTCCPGPGGRDCPWPACSWISLIPFLLGKLPHPFGPFPVLCAARLGVKGGGSQLTCRPSPITTLRPLPPGLLLGCPQREWVEDRPKPLFFPHAFYWKPERLVCVKRKKVVYVRVLIRGPL